MKMVVTNGKFLDGAHHQRADARSILLIWHSRADGEHLS